MTRMDVEDRKETNHYPKEIDREREREKKLTKTC